MDRSPLLSILNTVRSSPVTRIVGWVTLPLFPLLCLILLDYMNFAGHASQLIQFWQNFPGAVVFELLVMGLVSLLVLLVCRGAALSAGVLTALTLICSYVNYTKVALNGDHFMPQDFMMLSNAGGLASFISGNLPVLFWLTALALILWTAALGWLGLRLPLSWKVRLPAAVLAAVLAWLPCSNIDKADVMLGKFGMSVFDSALQSSNYTANGFVGAFTVNLLSLNVQQPKDYDRQTVETFLSGYEATAQEEGAEDFDVIVILSESFFDARSLPGVEFSQNPLPNYDRLRAHKNCYSGRFYSTAIGGGTVRPEFGVLTGLTTDYVPSIPTPYRYVSRPTETYVSHYRDAGYRTIALHPYNEKFYSRNSAYGHLGFDEFHGQASITGTVYAEYKRGFVTDETTLRAIEHYADGQEQPVFLFAITMQNHQPFDGIAPELMQIGVSCDSLSEPALTALTTYTQGLYDADKMLGELAAWIDKRERPTVLAFFGDHLPTLGSNHLAYNESGLFNSRDGVTHEEAMTMYATPFLIYSNRTLDPGLFSSNRDNVISDFNLLNAVALSTGFGRTAYMQLLLDFYRTTPAYNVRLGLERTESIDRFAHSMELITYDRIFGENYTFIPPERHPEPNK